MNTIKPSEIDRLLGERADQLARYLLPNGKRNGNFWEVGSADGDSGQSCKVYLNGKGYYDFAEASGGDYLELWQASRGCDFPTAIEQAKQWLGIQEPERKKTFKPAVKPKTIKPLTSKAVEYLQSRGLSNDTIKAFRVTEDSLKGKPAILFPYLVDGELKHFKQIGLERPNGKKVINASAGTEPCLFGWQAVPSEARAVVICEGEIDAMTFGEYGMGALSVPFGGGEGGKQDWIENEYGRLARFEEIYICMDMDDTGQAGAKEIANRLGLDRCKLVKLPKNDINDCLLSGMTQDEVLQCLAESKHLDIDEIARPSDFADETIELMYAESETARGFDTPWHKVNCEWRPGWNELTLVNGINAHGKSELVNMMVMDAALKQGHSAFIASMEIPHKLLNRRLIRQATHSTKPVEKLARKCLSDFDDKIWFANFPASFTHEALLDTMTYAYRRYGIKVFLIDSLMKCGIAEDDYTKQKLFVEKLCDFKNQYPVHVFLVVHPRKGLNEESAPGKMDVAGAGGITNLADNLLTVFRNKHREEVAKRLDKNEYPANEEGQARREKDLATVSTQPGVMLALQKDRNGGNEQKFGLYYRQYQHIEAEHPQYNKHYVTLTEVAA